MAKIEMDVSEWEAMKEKQALLEEAHKREKELGQEIKSLQEEKIKILEESKMKVNQIITTEIHKFAYLEKEVDYEGLANQIYHLINSSYVYSSTPMMNPDFFKRLEILILQYKFNYESDCKPQTNVEYKSTGIEEFKVELKAKLKEEMDADTKQKLEEFNSLMENHDKALLDNQIITKNNAELSRNNYELNTMLDKKQGVIKEFEVQKEELEKREKKLEDKIENMHNVVKRFTNVMSGGIGFFNYNEKEHQLQSVLDYADKVIKDEI